MGSVGHTVAASVEVTRGQSLLITSRREIVQPQTPVLCKMNLRIH